MIFFVFDNSFVFFIIEIMSMPKGVAALNKQKKSKFYHFKNQVIIELTIREAKGSKQAVLYLAAYTRMPSCDFKRL